MTNLVSTLITAWPQVARRIAANRWLMSMAIAGVVLASAIMSGTVMYYDALRNLALANALDKISADETNVALKSDRGPTTYAEREKVARATEREIEARVGWMLRDMTTGSKTATFFLSEVGEESEADTENPRAFFGYLPRLPGHSTILPGGRASGDEPTTAPDGTLTVEAIVPQGAAEDMGVGVGDRLAAVPYWSDETPYVHVLVTGLFEAHDPDDEFWHLNERIFRASTTGTFRTLPFYVTEKAYFETLGAAFGQMNSTYGWLLMVDAGKLDANNSSLARASLAAMEDRLMTNLFSYRQITELEDVLTEYDLRLFFSKLPMFVALVLIAVVVLYYVATLSSLVVERQRGEIVLLKSRGASSAQVLSVYVMEGLTVAALSILVAPPLASGAISLMGHTPAFSDLSGGGRLSIGLSAGAYAMAAVGGLLSFAALLAPAIQASRMSVTTFRQQSARPYTQPFYQRYYLDVLLLAIGVLLLRQLSEQGSVVAVGIFGEVAVNQALLAVPAIMLAASALALLRLFPLFMRVSSALLSSFLPAGLALGVWQMARNPTHYARLSLMLILMAGLGIFAASFGGTLQRNFEDRALYATGSDLRLQGMISSNAGYTLPMRETLEAMPAVEEATLAFRGFGSDLSKIFAESYTMFAVEGDRLKDLAWYRDDFSDTPIEDMLGSLSVEGLPEGAEIPAEAVGIGARVKPDRSHPSVALAARVRDANDRHFTYLLGELDGRGWRYAESSLRRENRFGFENTLQPTAPLKLVSLSVHETNGRNRLRSGSLSVDEIYARMPDGGAVSVESFDSVDGWSLMRTVPEAKSDVFKASDSETGAAAFIWVEGRPLVSRGVFPGPPRQPLPAIASSRFLRTNDHRVGETIEVSVQGRRLDVTLVDSLDFFPSLDAFKRSYLITDLDAVVAYANLEANSGEIRPNEAWMRTGGAPSERESLLDALAEGEPFGAREIHDRQEALAESRVDPLVDAGWRALLFIAFASVLILSALGFMAHAYVSFRSREIEFALMRTVGFSMGQLTTLALLEQALVIGAGLALGFWIGGRLGESILPFLAHDDRGAQALPPFVVDVNWQALGITYAAMALTFAVIIAGVIILVRRISLQRILRLGEA